MLISQATFLRYQQTFATKVKASPYSVILKTIVVTTTPGSLEEFTGDSARNIGSTNSIPCLYEKTINPRQREKYGLPDTVDGVLFISPLQLIPLFGSFRLSKNKTIFIFQEREQVIENITYLELLHNSCISVQINLKDSLKGG